MRTSPLSRQQLWQILGSGLTALLLVAFGTGPARAQVPAETAAAEPPLTLADCLRIAAEKQPALAAYRASLAAAQTQYNGLKRLHAPPLVARDLPIRRKQACLGITIADAGLEQAQWETAYAVTRTYFGVLYAREQQLVAQQLADSLRFYQERVRDLVKKGETREYTTNTVDKITLYLKLAETRHAEATRGLQRAASALREAMGIDPGTTLRIAETPLPTGGPEVDKQSIVVLALARRGEMVQASKAAEVVELEVEAQGKTHLPTAKTFAAVADVHARPVPQGQNNGEYRPGATSLEMPTLFAGPKSERVERARDLSARAAAVVDKTRNLVALEAEDAYYKWEEAARKIPQTREASEAGARLAKNDSQDFSSGQKVRIEDLLTDQVLAAQAKAAYNEALYQQAIALAGLQRVTAGGFLAGFGAMPQP
jgi:outer membrane protein TolC